MDFDIQWVLLGLPVAFALGWLASRFDFRQLKREQRDAPKAYFKGLNLLLNEQHDKAIDAFIEAVQQDPDTSDLHFALGNLFRRRGEYERAVRVHQHLLNRADLPPAERDRAQHGLAQDFMQAGLFDRAETAWRALEGTAYDTDARLALLTLHERSRDWRAAVDDAQKLERGSTGSYASRIAHYWCELALEADAKQQPTDADDALRRAHEAAPQAARPMVMAGRRLARQGRHAEALEVWGELLASHPSSFNLVAGDYAASAIACSAQDTARLRLLALHQKKPSIDLLNAIGALDTDPASRRDRIRTQLSLLPTLSAAQAVLHEHEASAVPLLPADLEAVNEVIGRAAKAGQRYRCAACGFEAQHHHWQCPGCLGWDTYPPQRLEEL
ncbi:MAG TPA: lipopolysaccharide assembly protein LapB [Burkholderiaceae bacterium]|jgi:lipopolysaccharide biosynthesis regulator YciM|nr:lipopolysaccharide assembly protein LapB [Burkholderiaceae bacterium]